MSIALFNTLAGLVGDQHFMVPGDAGFEAFSNRFARLDDNNIVAVSRPADAEQVRATVAALHEAETALLIVYTASDAGVQMTGKGETVVLDLSRLSRILDVNVDNAFVRVEPGVSFRALATYFSEHDIPLLVDSERDADASVVASALSKGIGYTPYGEHALVQCGAEFATPYGELVRTGMGALPGAKTWQVYKYALGPYSDGLAIQSSLLVPTQLGVWVMSKVPAVDVLCYRLKNTAALGAALEIVRELKMTNVLPATVSIRPAAGATETFELSTALYGLPPLIALSKSAVDGALLKHEGIERLAAHELDTPAWRDQIALHSGQIPEIVKPRSASLSFVAPIEDRYGLAMMDAFVDVATHSKQSMEQEMAVVGRALLQTVRIGDDAVPPTSSSHAQRIATRLASAMAKRGVGLAGWSFEIDPRGSNERWNPGLVALHQKLESALLP